MTIVEKIRNAFSNPTINPIVGQSDYESVHNMHLSLNANARSILSHLKNGTIGIMDLTVPQVVYNTLYAVPFVNPFNPGLVHVYTPLSMASQISTIKQIHDTHNKNFNLYNVYNCALK